MKLLRHAGDKWIFVLDQGDKNRLVRLIETCPMSGLFAQPLSTGASPDETGADPQLLVEALAAQRQENQTGLRAWFKDQRVLTPCPQGYQLTLSAQQIDTLLQVLNDIRVGGWHKLGCPDYQQEKRLAPTAANLECLMVMELCGYFQMRLLQAL